MTGISKLYCSNLESADVIRYKRDSSLLPSHMLQFSLDKKPVVVWNVTRRCNLKCIHCYSASKDRKYANELGTEEALELIDSLARFKVPVLLFSGGEPLYRPDILELLSAARSRGLRVVISTNGTLITKAMAKKLKEVDLSYAGISLDGLEPINNKFRGAADAFQKALEGIRNCLHEGIKVGLRFTINRFNVQDVTGMFDLIERENIPRICFYHLVYAGRGSKLREADLNHSETRHCVDLIIDRTKDLFDRGIPKEVLTVDNHADSVYLYLRMLRENSPRAREVLELLKMNGGNSSGIGIGCISWDGSVHADQFFRHYSFGNVRERPFADIWTDTSDNLMAGLKDRRSLLKGRCKRCIWQNICNGNFRVRAEAVYDDLWAEDPACYLTEEEING